MTVVDLAVAKRMTEADYRTAREALRATYGDTATERTGRFDQELARLFDRSGWTQEDLARIEGKTQQWVSYRLRFGRFLGITTAVVIPKNLSERRFRGYWKQTNGINERQRFQDVQRLMADSTERSPAPRARARRANDTVARAIVWQRLNPILQGLKAEAKKPHIAQFSRPTLIKLVTDLERTLTALTDEDPGARRGMNASRPRRRPRASMS